MNNQLCIFQLEDNSATAIFDDDSSPLFQFQPSTAYRVKSEFELDVAGIIGNGGQILMPSASANFTLLKHIAPASSPVMSSPMALQNISYQPVIMPNGSNTGGTMANSPNLVTSAVGTTPPPSVHTESRTFRTI